jgi:transcriptional regulator with XRE-family HTH domain
MTQAFTYKEIGRRLYNERRRAGRTQADLARVLGVREATITRYERGTRRIPIPALQQLADALGVPLDHLLTVRDPLPYSDLHDEIADLRARLLRTVEALDAPQARLPARTPRHQEPTDAE